MKTINKILDWRWRINHLYKIVDKSGSLIQFKENHIQKKLNDSTSRRKQILKYRQGGVSTNEIIKLCDAVFFHKNTTACLLAHDNDGLETIFSIAKTAYRYMPEELKPELDRGGGSKFEMSFPSLNSSIYADLEVRGGTIHRLHISEAAFADPNRIKATLEAVPINGYITWETTPNGMGNHFYRRWIQDDGFYEKVFFPWFIDPQYKMSAITDYTDEEKEFIKKAKRLYGVDITSEQIGFRRFKKSDLKELFIQEYPEDDISCFLASGGSPLDLTKVQAQLNSLPEEPDEHIKIFKTRYQTKSGRFVVGCDTAEGVRRDYSVAVVLEAQTLEVCAILRSNNMRPIEFAHGVFELAKKYLSGENWPLVAVERNNHGHAVLLELEEHIQYPNLFRDHKDMLGWKTDSITRPLMIDAFIEALESGVLKVNSREILYECLTLVEKNGRIEAEDGETDDCIIASSIALQMAIKHGRLDLYDNLSSKILL